MSSMYWHLRNATLIYLNPAWCITILSYNSLWYTYSSFVTLHRATVKDPKIAIMYILCSRKQCGMKENELLGRISVIFATFSFLKMQGRSVCNNMQVTAQAIHIAAVRQTAVKKGKNDTVHYVAVIPAT